MAITQVPAFTKVPNRSDANETYSNDVDTFLSEINARVTSGNQQATELNDLAITVDQQATDVEVAKGAAEAAAASAVAAADATAHVPGAAYSAGNPVWSNVDYHTYRCKLTHTGVATDPSADEVNWVRISTSATELADIEVRARNFSRWIGA